MHEITKAICRQYFKTEEGKPFELTDGQCDIMESILKKKSYLDKGINRVQIIASTQYGKSNTVAMSLILSAILNNERWAIVTGSQPKSDVIMGKVIEHMFDSEVFYKELEYDSQEILDRLKRQRNRQNLNFKGGGGIKTFAADARNRSRVKEALMGFGSPNIVEDESALIPDDLQSTVMRMLGGYGGGYLVKIGNPINRNHFYRTWNSSKYHKIFIDYKQAIAEGRYNEEFVEEMRQEAFFDMLYECKFPEENELDSSGYFRLITDTELEKARVEHEHFGELRLGFDVGEGGDASLGVIRSSKYAEIVHTSHTADLMATTRHILDLIKKYNVKDCNVFIDGMGIGAGVVSRLKELGKDVCGVRWGEKASKDTYANLKAEHFMLLQEGIKNGLKLKPHDGWNELSVIRYKKDTSDRIKIKTKEEMRKEGIPSPNVADAIAMTYNRSVEEQAPRVWTI